MNLKIVNLEPDDPRLEAVWPVMRHLRADLDAAGCAARYAAGHPDGYRLTALLDDGACRAVAGWRVSTTLAHGRNLYVDDLVTDPSARSQGHGAALLAHLADRARETGCARLHLDSGVQRDAAHRFYFREGLHISSYHFVLDLEHP